MNSTPFGILDAVSVTIHDDAFFYAQIAHHFLTRSFFTFDSINPTNGFHPLYLMTLVVAFVFMPHHGPEGVGTLLLVHALLIAAAAYTLLRLMQHLGAGKTFIAATQVAFFLLFFPHDIGLEAPLVVFFVVSLCATVARSASYGDAPSARLAALSFLLVLSRTDQIVSVLALASTLALSRAHRKVAAALAVGSFGAAGLWALTNLWLFGALTTVSHQLKAGWPGLWVAGYSLGSTNNVRAAVILLSCCAIIASCFLSGSLRKAECRLATAYSLAAVAQLCAIGLLLRFGPGSWYFSGPLTFTFTAAVIVALGNSSERAHAAHVLVRALPLAFLCALITSQYATRLLNGTWTAVDERRALAYDVATKLSTDEKCIFAVDGAGALSYWSRRCVINGDGLVNSYEYIRALKAGTVADLLCRWPIELIVTNNRWGPSERLKIPVGLSYDAVVLEVGDGAIGDPVFANGAGRVYKRDQFLQCG